MNDGAVETLRQQRVQELVDQINQMNYDQGPQSAWDNLNTMMRWAYSLGKAGHYDWSDIMEALDRITDEYG